jgi:hypothetical protein
MIFLGFLNEDLEKMDHSLRLAAFRYIVSQRLRSYGPTEKRLLESDGPYHHTGESDMKHRATNALFCHSLFGILIIDFNRISSIYHSGADFWGQYTDRLLAIQKILDPLIAQYPDYSNKLLRASVGELFTSDQFLVESERYLDDQRGKISVLMYDIKAHASERKIQISELDALVARYYVDREYFNTLVSYYEDLRKPERRHESREGIQKAHVQFTKGDLDIMLRWLIDKLKRFYFLDEVSESVSKKVMNGQDLRNRHKASLTNRGESLEVLLERYLKEESLQFLFDTGGGRLKNVIKIMTIANYIMGFASEIIFQGMTVMQKFVTGSKIHMEQGVKYITSLQIGDDVRDDKGEVNLGELITKMYSVLLRSCHIVSTVWHMDYLELNTEICEEQKRHVQQKFEESLDDTDYPITRAGIKYRIKRSNIREAGLGLFLDEDLTKSQYGGDKLAKSKFGVPLLVYDGEFFDEHRIVSLYGGKDTLRPYSVGTGADVDKELDSYSGAKHDIARFINDCFNMLPEQGQDPDPNNQDPNKRTFRYNVQFSWTAVEGEDNDRIIERVRKMTPGTKEKYDKGHQLIVYTIPLESIASSDPAMLFKKGQELWLSYGYDYISKIATYERLKSLDFRFQDRTGFASTKRSQIDITIQESIGKFLFTARTGASLEHSHKENFKETISRMIAVNNVLASRPYSRSHSYYTCALKRLSDDMLKDMAAAAESHLQEVAQRQLNQPSEFMSTLFSRHFVQSKISRDLNVLEGDIPMDTVISILVQVAACYSACTTLMFDLRRNFDFDERDEDTCEKDDGEGVRVPSEIREREFRAESVTEVLKQLVIEWHVKGHISFNVDQWVKIFTVFRQDLDFFVEKLRLDGFKMESYAVTKKMIQDYDMARVKSENIKLIAKTIYRAVHSVNALDYASDTRWLSDDDKGKDSTVGVIVKLFDKETEQFSQQCKERFSQLVARLEKSKDHRNNIFRFDEVKSFEIIDKAIKRDILITAWAFVSPEFKVPVDYVKSERLISLITRELKSFVLPQWVYETESNDTGKKVFFKRIATEYASINSKNNDIVTDPGPHIELTYSIHLDIERSRFAGDEFERHGYVVESWVSRTLGPNFTMDLSEFNGKEHTITNRFYLTAQEDRDELREASGDSKYLPAEVDAQYVAIGICVKGLVYPSENHHRLSNKFRRDYEGECYVFLKDEQLLHKKIPIVCKTFEVDQKYKVVGHIQVLSSSFNLLDTMIKGSHSHEEFERVNKLSLAVVQRFFDKINTDTITFPRDCPFLRNKHTPIWPNTPFDQMPSSLWVLNVPVGENASRGLATFQEALSIVCNSYDIPLTEFLQGLEEIFKDSSVSTMRILMATAVVRIIGEAITLVPTLSDYRSDYAPSGKIGENYGEGTDGFNDCEDDMKFCISIAESIRHFYYEEGHPFHYIDKILGHYVIGSIGCSSSKKAAKDAVEDPHIRSDYKGRSHIYHKLAGMRPFCRFYEDCERAKTEYNKQALERYKGSRISQWFDDYLPEVILEGTGYTIPTPKSCESILSGDIELKDQYKNWAESFLADLRFIATNSDRSISDELSLLSFQDNPSLKHIGKTETAQMRINYSNFYTLFVDFWTRDMICNDGPLVADFLFAHRGNNIDPGQWVYGVTFKDFLDSKDDIHMYPMFEYTRGEYEVLSPVAKHMVYPPRFAQVRNEQKSMVGTFGRDVNTVPLFEGKFGSKLLGLLTQKKIIAYLNHKELYNEAKKNSLERLVTAERSNIRSCHVYTQQINDNTEMVQFVFHTE